MNEMLSTVINRFNIAEDYQIQYTDEWDKWYKLYRNQIEASKKYPWRSKIFVPYTFAVIETMLPRIYDALTATKPLFQVTGIGNEDNQIAGLIEKLIDFQITRDHFKNKLQLLLRQLLINGTGITKQYWNFQSKKYSAKAKKILNFYLFQINREKTVENEYIIKDDPEIEVVNLYDFFVDPFAYNLETAKYIIHRTYKYIDDIKELSGKIYDAQAVERLDEVSNAYIEENRQASAEGKDFQVIDPKTGRVEILEYWENDKRITIAGRSIVLLEGENPFIHQKKPFARFTDYEIPFRFYGVGECEILEYLQHDLNAIKNQRRDNITLALNNMWKRRRGSNIDDKDLLTRPNGIIDMDNLNDLAAVQFPDVTQSSYIEEEKIINIMQFISGVTDYVVGQGSKNLNQTATGVSLLQAAADSKFKFKVQNIIEGLKEIIRQYIKLDLQYLKEDKVERLLGEEGKQIFDIAAYDSEFDLDASVAIENLTKLAKQQQMLTLYQLLRPEPGIDYKELQKRLMDVYEIKNADDLFVEVEDRMQGLEGLGPGIEQSGQQININSSGAQPAAQEVNYGGPRII